MQGCERIVAGQPCPFIQPYQLLVRCLGDPYGASGAYQRLLTFANIDLISGFQILPAATTDHAARPEQVAAGGDECTAATVKVRGRHCSVQVVGHEYVPE